VSRHEAPAVTSALHAAGSDDVAAGGAPLRSVPRSLEAGAAWAWRFVVVAAALAIVIWVAVQLRVVLLPVFVALIAVALLVPLVELLDRWMPRLLATWVVLLTFAVALSGLAVLLAAPIRSATDDLSANWESARIDIESWLVEGPLGLSRDRVDELSNRVDELWSRAGSGLLDSPGDAARTAAEVVGGMFLAVVLVFFFLKDGPRMWAWALGHLRPTRRGVARRAGPDAFAALQGWIRGVAITGFIDGVLLGLALVVLGVPAAIPLAVLTFFAAFFPIVGATVAGVLATAIALASNGPTTAMIVAIVVLVVQQVEGDVVLPVVMYRQVSLHPVVVLVALAVGGAVAGIIGAIVAVPLTAAMTAAAGAMRMDDGGTGSDVLDDATPS
jgi:predicted PurR-regulated permease PerM